MSDRLLAWFVRDGYGCEPGEFLWQAERYGVGRAFALGSGKFPPPVGVTGATGLRGDDPAWTVHAAETTACLAAGGNAGLKLDDGWFAVDLDTKKLADDSWGKVEAEVEGVLGGLRPHNTTSTIRCHGHYIFKGFLPPDVSGKLRIDGIVVGDVIRPDHRYLCTGPEYLCWWSDPSIPPEGVLPWLEPKPRPAPRSSGYRRVSCGDGWRPAANPPLLPTGTRNDGMASLAGIMYRKGATFDQFCAENVARCRPPLPDAEIEAIWASVGRYH